MLLYKKLLLMTFGTTLVIRKESAVSYFNAFEYQATGILEMQEISWCHIPEDNEHQINLFN